MEPNLEELRGSIQKMLADRQPEEAARVAKALLQEYPDDARVNMLLGIALEQEGRIDEAFPYLRRATLLAPTDPETHHNLAVALLNQGDSLEAAKYAAEAIKLDPSHEQALELLAKCESGKGGVPFEADTTVLEPEAASLRTGLDDKPNFVWNLGPQWTKLGFGLVFYCVFSFAFLVWHPFLLANQEIRRDAGAVIAFFLYVTAAIASLFWMLIDIIDRREKFVWLLPMWICGISALPVLPLALYLAVGRKIVQLS